MEGASLLFSCQAPARIYVACIISSVGVNYAACGFCNTFFPRYNGEQVHRVIRLSGFESINSTTVTTDRVILLSFWVKIAPKAISEPPWGACPQTP